MILLNGPGKAAAVMAVVDNSWVLSVTRFEKSRRFNDAEFHGGP
jgi:hypothetical protein